MQASITTIIVTSGSLLTALVWFYALVNIILNMNAINAYRSLCIKLRHTGNDSITVIIPARNEAQNLKKLLPILLESKHFRQIVLVDDGSTDSTPIIAKRLSTLY